MKRGFRGVLSSPKTLCKAATSIGSPTLVPVPCASTYPVSFGLMPAFLYTCCIRASANCVSIRIRLKEYPGETEYVTRYTPCAAPLGIVMPGVLPSWLIPLPTITALIVSLSLRACSSGLITTMPQPSPRPYPVPRLSKENDRPSSEKRLEPLAWKSRLADQITVTWTLIPRTPEACSNGSPQQLPTSLHHFECFGKLNVERPSSMSRLYPS